MAQKRVCVVGLGYIGLPTACIFADAGFDVLGVDVNPTVIKSINAGECHLADEPDLDTTLARVVKNGKLRASHQAEPADLFLICVPTPFREGHKADLTYVEAATQSVLPHVKPGSAIALESTSPPGTTEKIAAALEARGLKVGKDVHVAYCPERVLPGQILKELKSNARVAGGITPKCAQVVSAFYRDIVDAPVHETNARAAETVKLVENSFRDVNIAFANEISMMCDHLGIDHREVIRLANQHPRVKILNPGPGVGGHCIAVDPWFLVEAAPKQTNLIRTAREVNLEKTRFVVDRIKSAVSDHFKQTGKFQKIYLYGMAYKANVADFRESPAMEICHLLMKELGNMAEISAVDPYLNESSYEGVPVTLMAKVPAAGPDVVTVRLVPHRQFEGLPFSMDYSG